MVFLGYHIEYWVLCKFNHSKQLLRWFLVEDIPGQTYFTAFNDTVVKRGHTEGIEREKTSSQKSTVIAFQLEWQVVLALEGIALKSKLPRTLPSN